MSHRFRGSEISGRSQLGYPGSDMSWDFGQIVTRVRNTETEGTVSKQGMSLNIYTFRAFPHDLSTWYSLNFFITLCEGLKTVKFLA